MSWRPLRGVRSPRGWQSGIQGIQQKTIKSIQAQTDAITSWTQGQFCLVMFGLVCPVPQTGILRDPSNRLAEATEMDSEAIQSQIDLSLSLAYDMVSSWMKKPATVHQTASSSAIREAQKEAEEHMYRPPRSEKFVQTFFFLSRD